jgi:hypothetical protein
VGLFLLDQRCYSVSQLLRQLLTAILMLDYLIQDLGFDESGIPLYLVDLVLLIHGLLLVLLDPTRSTAVIHSLQAKLPLLERA